MKELAIKKRDLSHDSIKLYELLLALEEHSCFYDEELNERVRRDIKYYRDLKMDKSIELIELHKENK